MKPGIQLYTLRQQMEKDYLGTLARVAEIGYRDLEFAGYGGFSANELREHCHELGLTPRSTHIPFDQLNEDEMAYAKTLGVSYLVCPWLSPEMRTSIQSFERVADRLNEVGEKVKLYGLTLLYHHHDFELTMKNDAGQTALDVMLSRVPADRLKLEMDVYWAEYAGYSAISLLKTYGDRCVALHVKDMSASEDREYCEVGAGVLDFAEIFSVAPHIDAHFVEQDQCPGDPFVSIAQSFAYLKDTLHAF
ncbi:sugar phosphate isomerase/epimerase family protein [Ferroacidibacillus organovorans]|uniref:Xylose isomerase-like TIM barrel domain-containing protein n=1 Tax=Ferroacidibacillus organovorans TaxID=1765683 RepID=A0A853KBQ9_9BACL|nr:sugar phosphate isomerase/epimerase [Ferroacidibacillus organovorans]KYP81013.1 hypothetical protein AYJ22_09180 [Ferroacidibacillus organovorans]OAG94277.1 hypothetical protein AYW79_05965 [Ferroacidibacillus organovorans]